MTSLHKSTGGVVGTFMALSTILGSGMMILPGTSYHQLDRSAWMPWAIAALSVVPLLYCYAWLGRRHPSASGLSYYSAVASALPSVIPLACWLQSRSLRESRRRR